MHKRLTVISIIVALLLVALTLGCGAASQGPGQGNGSAAAAGSLSASDILTKAVAASSSMKSGKVSFEANIAFDTDPAKLPAEAKAFTSQPIKLSGSIAASDDPVQVEAAFTASLAGQNLDLGLQVLDSTAWIKFMDQWYQTPPELQQSLSDYTGKKGSQPDINQILSKAGIDPKNWLAQLTLVGEEPVNGVATYHLTARPDVAKMLTDVFALVQSTDFQKMMGGATSASTLPAPGTSADMMQQIQGQLQSMIRDSKVEMWVAKDGFTIVKAVVSATLGAPAGQDSAGMNAINLTASMQVSDVNTPLDVQAPASSKSWADFQKAIAADLSLFQGLFSTGTSTQ